jgi:signal transduction histidine kinase
VPIRDDGGRVIRWFGTNTDVTEQLLLQEQLKQADQRKDEFLAMLAHELRNPVAPIRAAAEVLALLLPDVQGVRAPVSIIQRQAEHLARLLDDLLDVARITQRRIEIKREIIDLRRCVEAGIETVEPSHRDKGQQLIVTQAINPLYVSADMIRVSLCIANLLSNSVRYTPAGGEIRITSDSEQGVARVTVADTGIGISADFLPRVFDLFSQAGRSLDRSQGGLGVGLFLCRELIEMHGGTVTAASAGLTMGSTFRIRLPLCEMPGAGHDVSE